MGRVQFHAPSQSFSGKKTMCAPNLKWLAVPHPMVSGNRAVLRYGVAYAPANALDRTARAQRCRNGTS
jgi:hypothetical protein